MCFILIYFLNSLTEESYLKFDHETEKVVRKSSDNSLEAKEMKRLYKPEIRGAAHAIENDVQ